MADTREFEEVEYGTVATLPDGTWKSDKQYDIGKIVEYDGSSYAANKKPPIGTLPTDKNYWQISAQGASKATSTALGVVKPDNTTTEVDENAVMSVKTATQSTKGIVKGSDGINVAEDGSIDVNTAFEQATQLANIIAGEAIASIWGKVSKSVATVMGLNENALLKNMLTSINVNDANKIPTAALTYAMQQAITKNENDITQLNSDLGENAWVTVQGNKNTQIRYNKRAGCVEVLIVADNISVTANTEHTLCTLPVGYRPFEQVRVANYRYGSYIMISANGEVILSCYDSSAASALWVRCNVVFQACN